MEFLFGLVVFLLGLVVGSFVNVVGLRLPQGEKLTGRSYCDRCAKKLTFRELIPVFSFLIQQGRCRSCKTKIFWQYPLVELGLGFWFAASFLIEIGSPSIGFSIAAWMNLGYLFFAGSIFFAIIISDIRFQIIPDKLLAILGLLTLAWLVGKALLQQDSLILGEHFLAGLAAGSFFLALWLLTRGKGMGFGDVKLAGLIGLMLGFEGAALAILASFIAGALVGLGLIIMGKKTLKSPLPFGPFLAGATLIVLLIS
jgi:prepilin signal peptidase PulO-like enzyme (type II secretory pathway)